MHKTFCARRVAATATAAAQKAHVSFGYLFPTLLYILTKTRRNDVFIFVLFFRSYFLKNNFAVSSSPRTVSSSVVVVSVPRLLWKVFPYSRSIDKHFIGAYCWQIKCVLVNPGKSRYLPRSCRYQRPVADTRNPLQIKIMRLTRRRRRPPA